MLYVVVMAMHIYLYTLHDIIIYSRHCIARDVVSHSVIYAQFHMYINYLLLYIRSAQVLIIFDEDKKYNKYIFDDE